MAPDNPRHVLSRSIRVITLSTLQANKIMDAELLGEAVCTGIIDIWKILAEEFEGRGLLKKVRDRGTHPRNPLPCFPWYYFAGNSNAVRMGDGTNEIGWSARPVPCLSIGRLPLCCVKT